MKSRYSSEVLTDNKMKDKVYIKCRSKVRNLGNFEGVHTLINLARRLTSDINSLTFDFDNKNYKINTVLLYDNSKNRCSILFYGVFVPQKNMIQNCKKITRLYIDRTYRMRLRPIINHSKFLTILADVEGQPVPIAWALMDNKKSKTYEDLLKNIKNNFENLEISEIFINSKVALGKAPEKVFPSAKVMVHDLNYAELKVRNLNYAKVMGKEPTITQFFDNLIDIQIESLSLIIPARDTQADDMSVNPDLPSSSYKFKIDDPSSTVTKIENSSKMETVEKSEPCFFNGYHQQYHDDKDNLDDYLIILDSDDEMETVEKSEPCIVNGVHQQDDDDVIFVVEEKSNSSKVQSKQHERKKNEVTDQDIKKLKVQETCPRRSDNEEKLLRLIDTRTKLNSLRENTRVSSSTQVCSTKSTWTGFINKTNIGKISVEAQDLTGSAADLENLLQDTLEVVGTVCPENFWDYLYEVETFSVKEIFIVKFLTNNSKQKKMYDNLYRYLETRDSLGVFDSEQLPGVKDFYVMPFLDDRELKKDHRVLIGIIVAHNPEKPKVKDTSFSPKIVNVMSGFDFCKSPPNSPSNPEQCEEEFSFETQDAEHNYTDEDIVKKILLPGRGSDFRKEVTVADSSSYLESIGLPPGSDKTLAKQYKRFERYPPSKPTTEFSAASRTKKVSSPSSKNVESCPETQSNVCKETMSPLSGHDLMKKAEEIYAAALAETESIVM